MGLCLCVCLYVCICVCAYACVCVCVCVSVCNCVEGAKGGTDVKLHNVNLRMSHPYTLSDILVIFTRKLGLSCYNEEQELIINNLQRKNRGATF